MGDGASTSEAMAVPAPRESDQASERIARLLEHVRSTASPAVWQSVESLVRELVDLYGRGLSRTLDALGSVGVLDERVARALAADELVSSLLTLHGLHPEPAEVRIRRALEMLEGQLGRVEVVALDQGVVRLRAVNAPPLAGAAGLLEQAVHEAAPEVERIDVEGLRQPTGGKLVQIDLLRSRPGA